MRNHLTWLLMGLFLLLASAPARGQYGDGKWEISPFGGFETGGSVPVTNSLTIDRLRVDSGTSFGTFLDYGLTENAQAELMWNRNMTSFSERNAVTGIYSKAFNSDIDQFHFGFLYMLRNSERKLRPFIAGGIGFTHNSNSGANSNKTAFSYGIGGGMKYYLTRHLGLRGDLRFVPTYGNRTTGIICDPFGFCSQARLSNYFNRGNFTGGIIFRF
jgi:outer membrane protein with beta-barrel domain